MYRKQLQNEGIGLERHSSMPEMTRDEFLEKQKTLQRKSSFGSTESVKKRVTKTKVSSRLLQPTASSVRKQKEKKQYVPTSNKKNEVFSDHVIKTADSGYASQTFVHYGDKKQEHRVEESYSSNASQNEFHERSVRNERMAYSREVQSDSEGVYKPPTSRNTNTLYASDAEYETKFAYFSDAEKTSNKIVKAQSQQSFDKPFSSNKTFSTILNESNQRSSDSDSDTRMPISLFQGDVDFDRFNRSQTTIISRAKTSLHESKTFQYVYTIDAELSYREYNKLMSIIAMLQEQKRKWEDEVQEIRDKLEKTGKEKMQLAHNNHILRQSLEAANRAIKEINGKVQELKQSLVPLREENSQIREEIVEKDNKIKKLQDEKINAINETHEVKKVKSNIEQKTIALEHEYEKYKTNMHEKFKNLEETYRNYQQDMEKNNSQNLEGIDDLRKQNEELTTELNATKLDYKRLENELEKTKVLKENLEYQNSNIELDTKREVEKLEALREKEKSKLEEKITEMEIDLSRQKRDIAELEMEKKNIINDYKTLESELKNSTNCNSTVEKLCEVEKEKNGRLQLQIEELKIKLQQIDDLKMINEQLTNDKVSLNNKILSMEEKVYELTSRKESLESETTVLTENIQSLQNKVETLNRKEQETTEKSSFMNEEIREYREQIMSFQNSAHELEATKREFERLETRLVSSQQQIAELSIANQQSISAKEQMEIELATLQRKLNERPSQDYLDELRREITDLQIEVSNSNNRVIEESAEKENIKREFEEYSNIVTLDQQVLKTENVSLKKQIEKLSNDVTEIDREKRQEASEKERFAIELELLKRELERKPSDNETEQWKNEITQLRIEINDYERNLSMEKSEKEKYINEITELQSKYESNNKLQINNIENLKQQVKELTQNITNLDKSNQNEISDRRQVEFQLEQVQRELNRRPTDAEMNSLKTEIAQIKTENVEKNRQLNMKVTENESLITQITSLEEKLAYQESLNEREKEGYSSQMNRLTENITIIDKEKQNEITNRKRLELELEQITRELSRKPSDTEIGNWKSEISKLRLEISEINKLKYQETAQREQLKNEYDELNSKFKLQKQLNENEIISLKDQLKRLKIDINEIDTQKHEEITQRQLLEREMALLKNELNKKPHDKELKLWQEEISKLKTNINELTRERNEEKTNREKLQFEIDDLIKTKQRGDSENKNYFDEINRLKIKVIKLDEEKNFEKKEKLKYEKELEMLRESMRKMRESQLSASSSLLSDKNRVYSENTNSVHTQRNHYDSSTKVVSERVSSVNNDTSKVEQTKDTRVIDINSAVAEKTKDHQKSVNSYTRNEISNVSTQIQNITNRIVVEENIMNKQVENLSSALSNKTVFIKKNTSTSAATHDAISNVKKDYVTEKEKDAKSNTAEKTKTEVTRSYHGSYTKVIDGKTNSTSNSLENMILSLMEETSTSLKDEKVLDEMKNDVLVNEDQKNLEKKRKMKEIEEKIKKKREHGGIWALKTPSIDSLSRKSTDTLGSNSKMSKELMNSEETLKENTRRRDRSSSAQRSHSADPKQYEPVGRPLKTTAKRERGRSPQRRNRAVSSENFQDNSANKSRQHASSNQTSTNSIDEGAYTSKMTSSTKSASQRSSTQILARSGEMSSSEMSLRERRKRSEERRKERLKNQANQEDSSNESQEELSREKRQRRRSKGRSKESLERNETNDREDFLTQAMMSRQQASTKKPGMRQMKFRENERKGIIEIKSNSRIDDEQNRLNQEVRKLNNVTNVSQEKRINFETRRDERDRNYRDERDGGYGDKTKGNYRGENSSYRDIKESHRLNESNISSTPHEGNVNVTSNHIKRHEINSNVTSEHTTRHETSSNVTSNHTTRYESNANTMPNRIDSNANKKLESFKSNDTKQLLDKNLAIKNSDNSFKIGNDDRVSLTYQNTSENKKYFTNNTSQGDSKNNSLERHRAHQNLNMTNQAIISASNGNHSTNVVRTTDSNCKDSSKIKQMQSKTLYRESHDVIRSNVNDTNKSDNRHLSVSATTTKEVNNSTRSHTTSHDPRYATVDKNFKYPRTNFPESSLTTNTTIHAQSSVPTNTQSNVHGSRSVTSSSQVVKQQRVLSESEIEQMRRMEEARKKVLVQQSIKTFEENQSSHANTSKNVEKESLQKTTSKVTKQSEVKEISSVNANEKIQTKLASTEQKKLVVTVRGQPLQRDSQENINEEKDESKTASTNVSNTLYAVDSSSTARKETANKEFYDNMLNTKETIGLGYNSYRSLPRNMKPLQQSISKQISMNSQKQSQSTNALTRENLEMHQQSRSYRDIKLHENMQRRNKKMAQYKDNNNRLSTFSNDSLGGFSQVTFATLSDEGKQYDDYATQYDGAINFNATNYDGAMQMQKHEKTTHLHNENNFHERDILKFARNIPKGHSKFNCEKCRELNMQRRGNQPIRYCWERYFPISESTPQPSMQSLLIN